MGSGSSSHSRVIPTRRGIDNPKEKTEHRLRLPSLSNAGEGGKVSPYITDIDSDDDEYIYSLGSSYVTSPYDDLEELVKLVNFYGRMNEKEVQTEDFNENELDLDLTDNIDRETQTVPSNATEFQRNRVEAIVQTDYRYIPLALERNTNTNCRINFEPKKKVDIGTQTEQTTTSVSTQTDRISNLDFSVSNGIYSRILSSKSTTTPVDRKNKNNERYSSLASQLPTNDLTIVTSPLLPSNTTFNEVDFQEDKSLKANVDQEKYANEKKDALELWRRLAPFALDELMPSFQMTNKAFQRIKKMVDVSIQTDYDSGESIENFEPNPPVFSKQRILHHIEIKEIDNHVFMTPFEVTLNSQKLLDYLVGGRKCPAFRVRAIFKWIADNVQYDTVFANKEQTTKEILISRKGVAKDFVLLFNELSFLAGLKTMTIQGFAKGFNHKVGKTFNPEKDEFHLWVAVHIFGSWRFVDPTYGSGHINEEGFYEAETEEHFFLTDPKEMIFTHFPYDPQTDEYERWQLLEEPITLEEFNSYPKVTPQFFRCLLRLRRPKSSPVIVQQQSDIQVASAMFLRYKFNMYLEDETEDKSCNEFVFCQLREGGCVGSFTVVPPKNGVYHLKVYAEPDDTPEHSSTESYIPHVFTFVIECSKARRYPVPWPIHEGAWGPTPRLYECGLDPINQPTPLINTWGGRKLLFFEKVSEVLLMLQIYDREGNLLDSKGILKKEETDDELRISIVPPTRGYFKLLIHGIPKPQMKGKWRLPLLAAYLVECKMASSTLHDPKSKETKTTTKKKVFIRRR